jgi:hypothetical protein
MQSFLYPCYLVRLLPIIFLNTLFSVTLNLCFCVSVNDQVYVHLCTCVNLIQKNLDLVRMYFTTSVFQLSYDNTRIIKTVLIYPQGYTHMSVQYVHV